MGISTKHTHTILLNSLSVTLTYLSQILSIVKPFFFFFLPKRRGSAQSVTSKQKEDDRIKIEGYHILVKLVLSQ